jgi:NAD(P)-dependent dehydrogenase (short-subunit alcohol dehydrogenase family)
MPANENPTWVSGKRVVITGATSGIGRAGAVELARRGAALAVVGRSQTKMDDLRDEIRACQPDADVTLFAADLSEMAQVRSVAETLAEQYKGIEALVLNAGVATRTARLTSEGHDEMLVANYFAPFLLTHLLLPVVRAAEPSRIVVTGSDAHRFAGRFDPKAFEVMGSYGGLTAQLRYGRTKLLDILFADELARRLHGSATTVNSFCPGLVNTGLTREVNGAERIGHLLSSTPFVRTPEQGARMLVHLASSYEVDGMSGQFRSSTPGGNRLPTAGPRRDPAVARQVYERTCEMLEVTPVQPLGAKS